MGLVWVLMLLVFLGGCGSARWMPSLPKSSDQTAATPDVADAPDTSGDADPSGTPASQDPLPDQPGDAGADAVPVCPSLTKEKVAEQLVAITRSTPADRVRMTRGVASEIFAEEAAFVAEGWPGAYFNGWRRDAWHGLEIEQDPVEPVATLHHGDDLVDGMTRFKFTCDSEWRLSGMGPEWPERRWYAPSPPHLPGQDGELTEAVALLIVDDLLTHYGTTRMRLVATGNELERGRLYTVNVAGGATLRRQGWGGLGPSLRLSPIEANEVTGEWLDVAGVPTGERIIFHRVDGLWKVADHTESSELAPVHRPGFEAPRPFDSSHLLGRKLYAVDNGGEGRLQESRGFTVRFQDGRMTQISALSGSTDRGLQVGDPVELAVALYGEPERWIDKEMTYISGLATLHIFWEADKNGERWITRFVLDWAPSP